MKKEYNKLVRDNIPQIIQNKGQTATVKILNKNDLIDALNAKLIEELNEYLEDGNVEELADVVQVVYGILSAKGIKYKSFEKYRMKKFKENGGFYNGIYLESVEENDATDEPKTNDNKTNAEDTMAKSDSEPLDKAIELAQSESATDDVIQEEVETSPKNNKK